MALDNAAFSLSIEYSLPRLDDVVIFEHVDDKRSSYISPYFLSFSSYSAIRWFK